MPKPLAEVYHLDCYGLRKDKYQTLLDNSISSLPWNEIDCRAPEYSFVAKDFDVLEQYEQGFSVCDLFPVNSSGIKTHRDDFVIDMDKATLIDRIGYFYDQNHSDGEIASKLNLKDNCDWKISDARQKETFNPSEIADVLYRPFDCRKIYYSSNLIDRGREKVMQHFLKGENVGLCFNRQIEQQRLFADVFVTSELFTLHSLSLKESNNIAPLFLYPENTPQQLLETPVRTPNLNPGILQQIAEKLGLTFTPEKFGTGALPASLNTAAIQEHNNPYAPADNQTFAPIDLLDYLYAVLHSPNYRETYKEFLKIDFPRVPYPDSQTFWSLVKLGAELRRIHLLESPVLGRPITSYPNDGDHIVTRKINKNDFEIDAVPAQHYCTDVLGCEKMQPTGRIWINNQQYFDGVPVIAWEFYIGGYQPAQKWLKDRHGRKLNFEDIRHYQKVIVALTETHRIMQTIDSIWRPEA